jgi:hypothetical protein
MSDAVKQTDYRTPKFRMMWPHLFERGDKLGSPKGTKDGDYEVTAFIPKTADISGLLRLIDATLVAEFGSEPGNPNKPNMRKAPLNFRMPIKDGDKEMRKDRDGNTVPKAPGFWIVRLSSKKEAPQVVDADRMKCENPDSVYSGRWAKALVNPFLYRNSGNQGLSFGLNGIQLLDHDTPMGGRAVDASTAFDVEPLAGPKNSGGLLD